MVIAVMPLRVTTIMTVGRTFCSAVLESRNAYNQKNKLENTVVIHAMVYIYCPI